MKIEILKNENGYYVEKKGIFTTKRMCFISCDTNYYGASEDDEYITNYFDSYHDALESAYNPRRTSIFWR